MSTNEGIVSPAHLSSRATEGGVWRRGAVDRLTFGAKVLVIKGLASC